MKEQPPLSMIPPGTRPIIPPGTRSLPENSVARPDLRGDSGIRPLPVERIARASNDQGPVAGNEEEFDMSGFGADDGEPVVAADPEPEELSDAYLGWRTADIPEGVDPKTVPYPEDLHEAMVKKLNQDPQLSREVDVAFARARRRPGPPIIPPPPRTTKELPKERSIEDMERSRADRHKELIDKHEEVTGVYNIDELNEQLRKMREDATPNKRPPEVSADPVQIFDRAELDRAIAKQNAKEDEGEELDDAYLAENMVEVAEGDDPKSYLYPSDAELVDDAEVDTLRKKISQSK